MMTIYFPRNMSLHACLLWLAVRHYDIHARILSASKRSGYVLTLEKLETIYG